MASNLRVDSIVPATGSSVSIGTATGGVNIPGVLTYEDVTNVDSVGVITARSGIRIGATGANTLITGNGTGIGIGTASASSKLHIESSGETSITFEGSSTVGAALQLKNNSNTANHYNQILGADAGGQTTSAINFYNADNANNEGFLSFITRPSGGAPTERLRIGSAGQFGIGGANYGTSGQVLTSQGSGSAVQWATPSSGLSHTQQWYLTNNGDTPANTDSVLPTNGSWQKQTQATSHAGTLGATMVESSGVFTFPVTGIWRIDFYGYWGIGASDSDHNLRSYIQTTLNNSSYSAVQEQVQSIKSDSTYTYQGWFQTFVFDVTNTSNCKCRFVLNPSGSNVYYKADASPPKTGALFMRLGDT